MHHSYRVKPVNLRRSTSTLAIALALVAALCIFFVHEVVALQSVVADLRANDMARIETRDVLVDLLDAETGQRGFLLTGDPRYLEPYHHGRNNIQQGLHFAHETTAMDEMLVADAPKIRELAERKLEELDRTVVLKKKGDSAGALQMVNAGYGKAFMDQARTLIRRDLDQLRTARDKFIDDLQNRLWRAAILLVLILMTVVSLAFYAWRSLSLSARINNELAKRLSQEASHDALTGLPNRRFFMRWARHLISNGNRERKGFALLLLDLDGFKKVNDALGHAVGDEVLKQAGARFQASLRDGEFLARLGGDEFGLLVEGELSRAQLTSVAERLIASLSTTLHASLPDAAVGTSIGVSIFPQDGRDIEALSEAADRALYVSKGRGRGVVSFAASSVLTGSESEGTPANA